MVLDYNTIIIDNIHPNFGKVYTTENSHTVIRCQSLYLRSLADGEIRQQRLLLRDERGLAAAEAGAGG